MPEAVQINQTTAQVPIVPATASKINWTNIIGGALTAITLGSTYAEVIPGKTGIAVGAGLAMATQILTIVQRTWFNGSVTKQSLASSR